MQTSTPPPCYDDGPRVVVTIGTPPDRQANFGAKAGIREARRYRQDVSELFFRISGGYAVRWACGPPKRIELSPVGEDERYTRNDAKEDQAAAGLGTEDVNMLLFYDSTTPWHDANGEGWSGYDNDSSPGRDNENNVGPRTSYVTVWRTRTFLHELTHSFGALQHDAPNNDGRAHCDDGKDVMCWWEPGRKLRFDFGRDDYFDPTPSGYLADHFNLATDSVWIERL